VLLEILSVALLVLRNCLLGIFGEQASRIRRQPLYIALVAVPLRVFHSLVVLSLRAPGWGLGVMLGLAVLCVFALFVGIVWWGAVVKPSLAGLLVFIVIPVIILVIEAAIFIVTGSWLERRARPPAVST